MPEQSGLSQTAITRPCRRCLAIVWVWARSSFAPWSCSEQPLWATRRRDALNVSQRAAADDRAATLPTRVRPKAQRQQTPLRRDSACSTFAHQEAYAGPSLIAPLNTAGRRGAVEAAEEGDRLMVGMAPNRVLHRHLQDPLTPVGVSARMEGARVPCRRRARIPFTSAATRGVAVAPTRWCGGFPGLTCLALARHVWRGGLQGLRSQRRREPDGKPLMNSEVRLFPRRVVRRSRVVSHCRRDHGAREGGGAGTCHTCEPPSTACPASAC